MSSPLMVEDAEVALMATPSPTERRATLDGLLTRVAAGDRRAFDALYPLVEARVFGLCLTLLRERQQAEEVTQETFLHIWQRAASFDAARGPAISWILRLARSKAIDRIRQSQASRVRDTQYAEWNQLPDTDVVVEEVLEGVQNVAVHRALTMLSDKQRQAVLLTYFGAMTSSQISRRLGIPASTVKTRIRDGLAKLGTHLAAMDLVALPVA
ncbi:sigma-70 family RNA polymerase sigma factor [Nakamurella sp. PAMC28650]|uniref:sigma-70 family RNA polymerase sigma factor n=1 Tax=Nakamurella sp. PAMC28650 TaxID=2762325 RepID=UPI00164DCA95|nr:sigma-70 family RNA polymerase sigma factor [Nakamurella sp. PAMC28650]QNK82172.1 sigma-70 family RNA polymerase sigma factor [Nakamurella sp. PAMC28650]